MVRLIAHGRTRNYQDRLDIPAGFEWVSSWLLDRLKSEAISNTWEHSFVESKSHGPHNSQYDFVSINLRGSDSKQYLMGEEAATPQQWKLYPSRVLIASFRVQGLGPERTRVSSFLVDAEDNPWGRRQWGSGPDEYEQGTYRDIWAEIRELWPPLDEADKPPASEVTPTNPTQPTLVVEQEKPEPKTPLPEDDGVSTNPPVSMKDDDRGRGNEAHNWAWEELKRRGRQSVFLEWEKRYVEGEVRRAGFDPDDPKDAVARRKVESEVRARNLEAVFDNAMSYRRRINKGVD